jgi:hypothetical protein
VSSLKALPETTLGDAELVKLYLLDLERPHRIHQISTGKGGAVSSPAFGVDGKLAWLEQQDDGNARGQRRLWLFDEAGAWEVPLDFDLSPLNVLVSRRFLDSEANRSYIT